MELSRKRPREHVSETKQAQKRCKQTDITKEVIDLTLDSVGDSIGLAVPSDCHVDVWDQFNMDNDMVPSFPANAAASASTVPNYVDWLHADAKDDPIDEYLKLHTTELYPVTNAPITGMASTLGGTYKSNRPATTRGYPRAVVNALDSSCSSASSQIQRPNQAFATHCRRDQKLGSNGYWSSPYSEGSTGIWTGLDESRYPHSVASDGWTNL